MVGVVLLYSLLAIGPMNVVSPITAVLAAAVPVVIGVLTGDRPAAAAWFGVAVGFVAVVLVSRQPAEAPTAGSRCAPSRSRSSPGWDSADTSSSWRGPATRTGCGRCSSPAWPPRR